MANTIKVYGWTNWRDGQLTREIVAASSKASAQALSPVSDVTETMSIAEADIAMKEPGIIFWTPRETAFAIGDKVWVRVN